ncbi:acyltransferase domain-containing protein [Nocardia sp. NPDC024068]|uniref:acyltransferase domain-containing protein n=1 Tax=Nocardia sp. NPDC024068 TaxID=3157197 RepID=UPI0033FB91E8
MNSSHARVVFLFPGEGGEHDRMGRSLAGRYPVFAAAVTAAGDAVAAAGGPRVWTPRHGFRNPGGPAAEFSQPALFAYQVATAELLHAWGVRPDAVLGHGLGELAAAVVAGALPLTEAAKVAVARGRALTHLSGSGAVAELRTSESEASRLVEPMRGRVGVAAVNGPRSVLVSGAERAVEVVIRRAGRRGIPATRTGVDYPAHHALVSEALPGFHADLGRLHTSTPHTRMYSGSRPGTVTDAGPRYWAANLTARVELDAALRGAAADGAEIILEVGPDPVLSEAVRAIERFTHTTYPTARRDDEGTAFLTCLAQFHAARTLGSPEYAVDGGRPWIGSARAGSATSSETPAATPGPAPSKSDRTGNGCSPTDFDGYRTASAAAATSVDGSCSRLGDGGAESRESGEAMRAEVTSAGTLASIRLADNLPPTDIIAWTRMVDANRAIRFLSGRLAVDPPMEIDRAGTYVVSGGLGALGSMMVRRLLSAGARDVVVPTRSPRPVPPLLEGFEDRVVVVRCDTADRHDLDNALRDIRESGCSIRGVVHAAQVFEETVVGAVVAADRPAPPDPGTPDGGPGSAGQEVAGDADRVPDPGRLARRFARVSISAANLIELTAADPVAFIAVFATPLEIAGPVRPILVSPADSARRLPGDNPHGSTDLRAPDTADRSISETENPA